MILARLVLLLLLLAEHLFVGLTESGNQEAPLLRSILSNTFDFRPDEHIFHLRLKKKKYFQRFSPISQSGAQVVCIEPLGAQFNCGSSGKDSRV
jgi:hypothetical protein